MWRCLSLLFILHWIMFGIPLVTFSNPVILFHIITYTFVLIDLWSAALLRFLNASVSLDHLLVFFGHILFWPYLNFAFHILVSWSHPSQPIAWSSWKRPVMASQRRRSTRRSWQKALMRSITLKWSWEEARSSGSEVWTASRHRYGPSSHQYVPHGRVFWG